MQIKKQNVLILAHFAHFIVDVYAIVEKKYSEYAFRKVILDKKTTFRKVFLK